MKTKEHSILTKVLATAITLLIGYTPFYEFIPIINPNNYMYYIVNFGCLGGGKMFNILF